MDGSQVFLDHFFRALNYPHERNCEQCDPKEGRGELKLTSHSIKECLSASLPDVLNFALIPEPGLASSGSPRVTAPLVLTEDDLRAASESGTPLPLRVDLAPSLDLDYRFGSRLVRHPRTLLRCILLRREGCLHWFRTFQRRRTRRHLMCRDAAKIERRPHRAPRVRA